MEIELKGLPKNSRKILYKKRKGLIEGDITKAWEKYYKTNICDADGEPVSLFSSLNVLNNNGVALRLYFSFVSQLIYLTLLILIFASFLCILNFFGGYYNGDNKTSLSFPARNPR